MKIARLAAVPKNRIVNLVRRYFAPAILAEGCLKGSTQHIRCLYLGDAKFQRYLFGIMFDDSVRITRSWQARLSRLREVFSREDFDIGIALIPKQYEPALRDIYLYRATKNVRQETCLSAPWEAQTRTWQNYSETRRRIRKAGLEHRISHDLKDLKDFYHHMFLPHIQKQYESRAYLDDYEDFRRYFEKGFLLLVEERGKAIAGGLCAIQGDTLVFYRTGVLLGSDEYVKKGAQAAIYYFMLLYARENRLAKVNFLMSHAFINDGVYRHKAGWGAEPSPDHNSSDCLLYFVPSGNVAAIAFFQNNPALVLNDQGSLDVLAGWTGSADELSAIRQRNLRSWAAPGLKSLQTLTSGGKEVVYFPERQGSARD